MIKGRIAPARLLNVNFVVLAGLQLCDVHSACLEWLFDCVLGSIGLFEPSHFLRVFTLGESEELGDYFVCHGSTLGCKVSQICSYMACACCHLQG